jgi:hypothetical protein
VSGSNPFGIGGRSVLLGIARLARGRADGLAQFGDTTQAFLGSLAPLIAFPLVGGGLMLAQGEGLSALAEMLATFCALLAPPVLSYWLARLWGRDALWLRFATAFNWCQWAIPVAASVLLLLAGLLMRMGLPNAAAGAIVVLGLTGYGFWLHWFIARQGLQLSGARSLLLVLVVNLGTAVLVAGPGLLALGLGSALHSTE